MKTAISIDIADIYSATGSVEILEVDRPGSEYDGLDPLIFSLRAQWLVY